MSFHLFFINGWGFESNFWKPTYELLILEDIVGSAEILDKNSLKKKAPKKIPINTIFITHSMGLNFFLEMKVDCLALINFFSAPSFLGFQKNYEKSKKSFDLMLNKFGEDPDLVLKKFFYNCGLDENYFPSKKIDYKKLKDQLIKLKNDNLINKFKSLNFKVLSFLSENDKIFQPSLEKFNSIVSKKHTFKLIPEANHAYPLNQPKLTAKLIYDFIQSLHENKTKN